MGRSLDQAGHWIREVIGSGRRREINTVNAVAEEQRTRELDVAGHMGSGIEGVRRTSDRMSPSGDVGVQVLEARRRRDRWGGAGTGRSTRKEDFPSNGAANWWA